MSARSDALANRIEQGARALAGFAETLSEVEWRVWVANDERTVGVLVHHVASLYPLEIDLARSIAAGNPIIGVDWEAVAQMNAQHARDYAGICRHVALALLRQNSHAAAESMRIFTDAQMDTAASISLNANAPLTAQFFIEAHAVCHSFHHLAAIRAALKR